MTSAVKVSTVYSGIHTLCVFAHAPSKSHSCRLQVQMHLLLKPSRNISPMQKYNLIWGPQWVSLLWRRFAPCFRASGIIHLHSRLSPLRHPIHSSLTSTL